MTLAREEGKFLIEIYHWKIYWQLTGSDCLFPHAKAPCSSRAHKGKSVAEGEKRGKTRIELEPQRAFQVATSSPDVTLILARAPRLENSLLVKPKDNGSTLSGEFMSRLALSALFRLSSAR
jgi:hypothetical protein